MSLMRTRPEVSSGSRSWRQVGAQLGLLTGIALVMVRGPSSPAAAAPLCAKEATCTTKKPLVLFVVDYSTAMNTKYNPYSTRWEAAVQGIGGLLKADNGLLGTHFMLGLVRYGHDPDPDLPGTVIPGDASGLVDGTRLDVAPYDLVGPEHAYHECTNAAAIVQALAELPAPLGGKLEGIERWTWGGLDRARVVLEQSALDHPGDEGRPAAVILITGGPWTGPAGGAPLVPPWHNPTNLAAELFTNSGVPTYVVTMGEASGAPFAAAVAAAGGTGNPLAISCPAHAGGTLVPLVEPLEAAITGSCGQGLPRVMFLLDSSSSMLNVANKHAPQGVGGWEEVREALAGWDSIFDHKVANDPDRRVEDLIHVGLSVFGFNAPAEEKVVVDYGPCQADNIRWALDPVSSCVAPGCVDPWGPPPIVWTFGDGSEIDPPGFVAKTLSHMPRCNFAPNIPGACIGSGTYTHLGLQLVAQNLAAYKQSCAQPAAMYPCTEATEFINILITDGDYNSTDAQVKAPLEAMHSAGVTTLVIGYGDLVKVPASVVKLDNMAAWGSGGQRLAYKAQHQDALEGTFVAIFDEVLAAVAADACCAGSCTVWPEPTTSEPDPVPETSWGDYCGWGSSGSSTSDATTSADSTAGTTSDETTTDETTTGETTTGGTTAATGMSATDGSSGEPSSSEPGEPTTTTPGPTPSTGNVSAGTDGVSSVTGESDPGEAGGDDGCGCTATGAAAGRLGLWLPLALLLRRRRRARGSAGAALSSAP